MLYAYWRETSVLSQRAGPTKPLATRVLFSEILGEKLTQNREILLKKYQERYANYMLTSGTDGDKVASVKEVQFFKDGASGALDM